MSSTDSPHPQLDPREVERYGRHLVLPEVGVEGQLRLRADLNPMNPSRSMPHYSTEMLSDEQASVLYTYIKSLTDDPPSIDDIPEFVEILEDAQKRNENTTNDE